MKMRQINSCLACLKENDAGYCKNCLKRLFHNKKVSHILPFSKPEFERTKIQRGGRLSISGVQPKHSMRLNGKKLELTETGGEYILKPAPHGSFQKLSELPANEHFTMQLAEQVFGIETAMNAMVFFSDGEPAYLTKRFDRRLDGVKLDQEDFSQIAERTEETHGKNYKYDFSYEEIGDLIRAHVGPYPIELEKFFRLVAFNYLVQNGDAHLKNFSLLRNDPQGILLLTPAYDLANTRLHVPEEADTALDLFKNEFETESFKANAFYAEDDFVEFGKKMGLNKFRIETVLNHMTSQTGRLKTLIQRSLLEKHTQAAYLEHVIDRVKRLKYSFVGRESVKADGKVGGRKTKSKKTSTHMD